MLNFCANNYLGLADNRGTARRRQGGARPLRLRHGLGALHLRHAGRAQAARGEDLGVPRHGGHDPLRLLLRRQWRPVRDAAVRRGRGHLGRAEPRLDHRRRAALQGAALPLRQQRHGRPRGAAEGSGRCALPADRHRRRLFDGRHHRQPRRRLRPRREIRRHGDGRRQPCRRLRRQARPRLAGALRRRGQGRHHHRHARQGAGRRLGRLHLGQGDGGRLAAPALAALSLLQHADAGDRRRVAEGVRADRERRCAARAALRQCGALPRAA